MNPDNDRHTPKIPPANDPPLRVGAVDLKDGTPAFLFQVKGDTDRWAAMDVDAVVNCANYC